MTDDQDTDMDAAKDLRHAANLAMGTEIEREYRVEDGSLVIVSYPPWYSFSSL